MYLFQLCVCMFAFVSVCISCMPLISLVFIGRYNCTLASARACIGIVLRLHVLLALI